MTATPILDRLAREFKATTEQVRNALEMLDAGLSAPFIGRYRRASVGALSESVIRRVRRRREELEELDRRRGTILRLLEREGVSEPSVLRAVESCMDRFELEDLFLPHRRPEPEVQLALDRGLGALAEQLVEPLPKELRTSTDEENHEGEREHEEDAQPEGSRVSAEEGQHEPADAEPEHAEIAAESAVEDLHPAPGTEGEEGADESEEGADERPARISEPEMPAPSHEVLTLELARVCRPYVSPDRGVHDESEALAGAVRILSDRLGRNPRLRGALRRMMQRQGVLSVRATVDESKAGRFRSLLKTNQPMRQIQGHRLLAIRHAQKERVLTTRISIDPAQALAKVRAALGKHLNPAYAGVLDEVCKRALQYRLLPMLEEDIRLELKERADAEALRYLSQHLRQLLLTPPLARQLPVAGIDVSAKGDWTVAIVDANGQLVSEEARIEVAEKDDAALGQELATLLQPGPGRPEGVQVLALCNAKGGRAALTRVRAVGRAAGIETFAFIVSESGLSSYANSELARRELEGCSVPMRMAVSIARRLQDPISEFLKVDARNLSLGSEQGLVSKANVRRAFQETIESCTAHVGCDVNRATLHFLAHLPGMDRAAAERIVARRAERPIQSREELREEGLLGEAQWMSSVAFLRVPDSAEPLDRTSLHPEQYPLARRILESVAGSIAEGLGRPGITKGLRREDFEVDEDTWRDLSRELSSPGRDPRLRVYRPQLLDPATDPATLARDTVVEGIVSNVASFGAFVDVGLAQDAMVHISEVSDRYVRDAREVLSVGQIVRARVLESGGQRLTLSLKNVPREAREPRERRERRPRGAGRGAEEGGRSEKARPPKNLRAAQTRRDGLVGGSSSQGRRGFGPGGPGGKGGARGGRRERGDGEERVDVEQMNRSAAKPVNNPFAAFFKSSTREGPEVDARGG